MGEFFSEPKRRPAQYRPDIDGLRMLAIVPVVLYHAGVPWLSGGFIGVDVFFVISGFLITRVLHGELSSGRFSLIGFYERRARRILPALITVLLASFVAGYFLLMPKQFSELSMAATAAALFAANFWFWRVTSDYFAADVEFEPLLHTWTLGVEEQFYILFPLLLWALASRSGRGTLWVVTGLTVLSFLVSIDGTALKPSTSFYLLPTRWWELGLGAMLALGFGPRINVRWLREVVAMSGLAAILAAAFMYDASTSFPGLAALAPCLGAAALISVGGQGHSLANRVLSLKPFVFVGLISYSLYLWHWPIFSFLRIYLDEITLPPILAAGAVVAAFTAAAISWAYVERPFRRRPPQGFGRAKIFAFSGIGISLVIVMAAETVSGRGLPDRFPADVRLAYEGAQDINPDRERCFEVWPDSGLCRFGAETGPEARADFLLWGDSHAVAIMSGVGFAAIQTGKTGLFAGYSSCPPLLGAEIVHRDPNRNCAGFNAAVLEVLQKRDDIPLVILAARWALIAEGHRPANEHGSPVLLAWADRRDTGPYYPEHNFEIFQQAISETIAAIRSTGRQVIILGSVPEIGWNVPRGLGDHLRLGRRLPAAPTTESVSLRHGRAESVLANLAKPPGVRFLPLSQLLCDPVCRTSLEGRPLYYDDDHLSHYGSIKIIGPLFIEKVWR